MQSTMLRSMAASKSYMRPTYGSSVARERYRRIIHAVQRRHLGKGWGIHAWVSLEYKTGGKRSNTFYISPELFGPTKEPA